MFKTTAFDPHGRPRAYGFGITEEKARHWCERMLCGMLGETRYDVAGRRVPRFPELLNSDDPFAAWVFKTEPDA